MERNTGFSVQLVFSETSGIDQVSLAIVTEDGRTILPPSRRPEMPRRLQDGEAELQVLVEQTLDGTKVAIRGAGFKDGSLIVSGEGWATVKGNNIVPVSVPLEPVTGWCQEDADCDDGTFCTGRGNCDKDLGVCVVAQAVVCDDRIPCTVDFCDTKTDRCRHVAMDAYCDNGLFCDGSEVCDESSGCKPGPAPMCGTPNACVYYVRHNAHFKGDGTTWLRAFNDIQRGIDAASASIARAVPPRTCQVWVAEGHYSIYRSGVDDTLTLRPHVEVLGGFAGTESSIDERNWEARRTVIAGTENGTEGKGVHHVVTGSSDAVLDGFVITGGSGGTLGAGMYNEDVSPLVRNCVFAGNQSEKAGAAVVNLGGAPSFFNCVFADNVTAGSGGGMHNKETAASIQNCMFLNNRAAWGGGLSQDAVHDTIVNSVFLENEGSNGGGAIHIHGATVSILNSTITRNSGTVGAGINVLALSTIAVRNSIVWGNAAPDKDEIHNEASTLTIAFSNIMRGALLNDSNIDQDPLFEEGTQDLRLRQGSPCIDAADGQQAPATDKDGQQRYDDPGTEPNRGAGVPNYVDMGAYEYQ